MFLKRRKTKLDRHSLIEMTLNASDRCPTHQRIAAEEQAATQAVEPAKAAA